MDARNRAFVVHLTQHRVRIKIPRWKRQDFNFAALQRALERRPGVVSVHVNPLVASIVIHCRDGFEMVSVRDCFEGLELVLTATRLAPGPEAWQIASVQRIGDRPESSFCFVGLLVKLTIAIATKRLDVLIKELIFEAAAQVLVRQLYLKLMQPRRLELPPALLVAAVG